MCRSLNYLKFI